MQFTTTNKGYVIRLNKGEKIVETLTSFCERESIHSGVFHGIGATQNPEIGYYHLDKKEYEWRQIEKMLEIVSLTGNVALVDNKPFLHIHTVLSDSNFQTYGGHLKEATVGASCEIYLTNFETDIERVFDEDTGLKLLSCNE